MGTPFLRFKNEQWQDFPDWNLEPLEKLSNITMGQSPDSCSYNENFDGLPLIQGNADIVNGVTKPSRYSNAPQKICKKGDIILTVRAPVGEVGIASENSCLGRGVCSLSGTKLSNLFLLYSLVAKKTYWKRIEQGSTFTAINSKDLNNFQLWKPASEVEQNKIATFFSTLDEKIELSERKLEALEQLKKGLMQKIFNQEIRFKSNAGYDFPDWVQYELQDICQVNPKTRELPPKFVYIDLESVQHGELLSKNIIERTNAPSRAQRNLQRDDVLFQTVRPYQQNNYLFTELSLPTVASTGYAQIRCTSSSPQFIYQLIHTQQFLNAVLIRCAGGTYPAINANDLRSIPVSIPCMEEQTKIGNFFKLLDKKIAIVKSRIKNLNQLKKGFMQQMFV